MTNTGTANLTNVTVDDDLTGTVDALVFGAAGTWCRKLLGGCGLRGDGGLMLTAGVINNIGTGDSDQAGPDTDPEQVPVPQPSRM